MIQIKKSENKRIGYEHEIYNEIIDKLPKSDSFTINFDWKYKNWLPFYWSGFKQTTRYTYMLANIADHDQLVKNYAKSKKQPVQKSKEKFRINFDLSKDAFYSYFLEVVYERGDTIGFSKDFFARLYDAIYEQKSGRTFYCTDAENNIHAINITVWDSDCAYYLMAMRKKEYNTSGGTEFLVDAVIKYVSQFVDRFDFEGSMIHGVEESYRHYGTRQTEYYTISKINNVALGVYRTMSEMLHTPSPPPLGIYDYGLRDTYTIGDGPASPLWLDGWLQWNEEMWGLTAERVCYCPQDKEVPKLEGVLYINKKGQVEMPPRNPYLPFIFTTSGTNKPDRIYNQYLEVMGYFSDDLKRRRIRGQIALPVGFLDARPFQWKGFITDMRYTFMQKLPMDKNQMADHINKNIKKSQKSGYTIKRSCDWNSIVECLETRGNDKGFSHHTDAAALSRCAELLGNDSFLGYIGYDSNGKPAAGGLRLMVKEGIVIDWSQGAITEHLKNGINQLFYDYVLNDVYNAGAKIFDWVGANIPPVALAKSAWGSSLVPYITIQEKNMRYAVRTMLNVTKSLFKKAS